MLTHVVHFANLFLAALLAGGMFGVWLFLNPARLDATTYVTVQQQAIRTLNSVMPALGVATILTTLLAAAMQRSDRTRLWLLVVVAVCFVLTGLITRFRNQPINNVVMTWRKDSPPSEWIVLRDQWWRWHLLRLATGLAGLSLLIATTFKRS